MSMEGAEKENQRISQEQLLKKEDEKVNLLKTLVNNSEEIKENLKKIEENTRFALHWLTEMHSKLCLR